MSETVNHNRTVGTLTVIILMAFFGLAVLIGVATDALLTAIKQPCTESVK